MDGKTLRLKLGMTQQQFADAIGASRGMVAMVEVERARYGVDTAYNIKDLGESYGYRMRLEDVLPRD